MLLCVAFNPMNTNYNTFNLFSLVERMKKQMRVAQNTYVLQVDITTSPEELAKGGECYATLQKNLTLSFLPFIGLRLAIHPIISDADESKYLQLARNIIFNRGLFNIASITYYTERSQFIRTFA